jgi:hypothetical protein
MYQHVEFWKIQCFKFALTASWPSSGCLLALRGQLEKVGASSGRGESQQTYGINCTNTIPPECRSKIYMTDPIFGVVLGTDGEVIKVVEGSVTVEVAGIPTPFTVEAGEELFVPTEGSPIPRRLKLSPEDIAIINRLKMIAGPPYAAPTATNVARTIKKGDEASFTLQGSADDDVSCDLTFTIRSGPTNGTLSPISDRPCTSRFPNADTAVLSYTHDGSESTSDSFTYQVCDGATLRKCATASVRITIVEPTAETPPNTPPTAAGLTSTVERGGAVTIKLEGSDAETCELDFSTSEVGANNGDLSSINDQTCASGSPNSDTAVLTYTHDGSNTTSDSFTYQVCDYPQLCNTATVSITVTSPAVTLNPTEGAPGTVVTATGSGWIAGHKVSVQWDDGTELRTTTVDDNGGFTVSFIMPDAAEGEYKINFVDAPPEGGSGYSIPATFTVKDQPTITLDPTEGPPGTEVTVRGSGWIYGDTIFIHFAVAGNKVAQATVGDDRRFVVTFTVPSDAEIKEQLVIAGNADMSWQTDTLFRVTEPQQSSCPGPVIEPSVGTGEVGDEITVQGQGWLPGGTVTFTITSYDGPEQYYVGSVLVPDSGAWVGRFTVPNAQPGDYDLVVSEDHGGCELRVTWFFTINTPTPVTPEPTPVTPEPTPRRR